MKIVMRRLLSVFVLLSGSTFAQWSGRNGLYVHGERAEGNLLAFGKGSALVDSGLSFTGGVFSVDSIRAGMAEFGALTGGVTNQFASLGEVAGLTDLVGYGNDKAMPESDCIAHIGQSNAGSSQSWGTTTWYDEPSSWGGHTNAFVYFPYHLWGPTERTADSDLFMNPPSAKYRRFGLLRGWGAYVPMAHILCEDNSRKSYQIVISDGGTTLDSWLPPSGLYTNINPTLLEAQAHWPDCPDFNGFVLYAHESSAWDSVPVYSNKLATMIAQLRTDYGDQPIVLVGYGDRYQPPYNMDSGANAEELNGLFREWADTDNSLAYVSTHGLTYTHASDNWIHYDMKSYAKLGGRIAAALKRLRATHISKRRIGAEEVYAQNGTFGRVDVGSELTVNGVKVEDLIEDGRSPTPISTENMILYYPMDGNSCTGVIDTATYTTDTAGGIVAEVGAGSGSIEITNHVDISDSSWSVSVWARSVEDVSFPGYFLGMSDCDISTNTVLGLYAGSQMYYKVNTNDTVTSGSKVIARVVDDLTEWHHFGLSYSAEDGQVCFVADGYDISFNNSYNYSTNDRPYLDRPWRIGFSGSSSPINVDDLIMFNEALTPTDFNRIYDRGRGRFYNNEQKEASKALLLSDGNSIVSSNSILVAKNDDGPIEISASNIDTVGPSFVTRKMQREINGYGSADDCDVLVTNGVMYVGHHAYYSTVTEGVSWLRMLSGPFSGKHYRTISRQQCLVAGEPLSSLQVGQYYYICEHSEVDTAEFTASVAPATVAFRVTHDDALPFFGKYNVAIWHLAAPMMVSEEFGRRGDGQEISLFSDKTSSGVIDTAWVVPSAGIAELIVWQTYTSGFRDIAVIADVWGVSTNSIGLEILPKD